MALLVLWSSCDFCCCHVTILWSPLLSWLRMKCSQASLSALVSIWSSLCSACTMATQRKRASFPPEATHVFICMSLSNMMVSYNDNNYNQKCRLKTGNVTQLNRCCILSGMLCDAAGIFYPCVAPWLWSQISVCKSFRLLLEFSSFMQHLANVTFVQG